ncbi:MAG TPA: glutamyl-tRNA reductase [Candidatus Dormibacteraeota bacterium]|nr:glutamyl-tRNA reductase [Candidatus Dormibacteraeota bacterium]
MELIAAGLSFHTAPLPVRERAAVSDDRARTMLRFLVGHSGLTEAAVLSTCNRTEFYLISPRPGQGPEVGERLARYLDPVGSVGIAEHTVVHTGGDAVRHLFRVAGGLDSMVLGEHQILGQVKHAHRLAREAGTIDAALDFVMKRAVQVGKRVRSESGLGRGTGSVAELAVRWSAEQLGALEGRGVLMVGAGEMSGLIARLLRACGARLWIASRGSVSAEQRAGELGGVAIPLARIDEAAAAVDLVVCSTDSPDPVLTAADVARFQAVRDRRPLAILDVAVPRDVEADAGRVEGVALTDLDALGSLADVNIASRRDRVPAAERIVDEEVPATMELLDERSATAPTIAALVGRAEEVRLAELDRSQARLALDSEQLAAVDVLTRAIVRKLLHAPIAHLKESADDPAAALHLREAFDLDVPMPARRSTARRSSDRQP